MVRPICFAVLIDKLWLQAAQKNLRGRARGFVLRVRGSCPKNEHEHEKRARPPKSVERTLRDVQGNRHMSFFQQPDMLR